VTAVSRLERRDGQAHPLQGHELRPGVEWQSF
jgi:hypothetical protein